jgi:hypothetical protein
LSGSAVEQNSMTKAKDKKAVKADDKRPEPSKRMAEARAVARKRLDNLPPRPEPTVAQEGDKLIISCTDRDDQGAAVMIMEALGTASNAFVGAQLKALLGIAGSHGKIADTEQLGSAFAFVAAVAPENELEAAMALQMYASHSLSLDMLTRAKNATFIPQMEAYGNLATKAQRTFTAQVEALTKLRTGGKQIVEHRHIYIDNRGGQAVIAENMTGGGGNGRQIEGQSYGQYAQGPCGPALLGADAAGDGMPLPRHEGPQPLPHSRRKGRRSQGKHE